MGAMSAYGTANLSSQIAAGPEKLCLGLQCWPRTSLPLLIGKNYALSLRSDAGHVRLLCTTLEANLAQGTSCVLMTPMAPDAFFQRAGGQYSSRLKQAISTGQLTLLTMIGDYKQNLVRFGPEKLCKEWEQCGLKQGALLIIDQAEQLFTLQHPDLVSAQDKIYRQWIEDAQCSMLLVFSGSAEDGAASIGYQRVLDNSSGSARIDCHMSPAPVWIDFWDTGTEILPESRLEWVDSQPTTIPSTGNSRHMVADQFYSSTPVKIETPAPDIDEVFCLGGEPVTFSQRKQPKWRCARDLIDLLHATRDARAAIVLIYVSKDSNWLHLAQAVHTMRQNCGMQLRIAILDRDSIMRYQNELLLLKLGANTVVHGQAAISRLPLLLQSLRSQHYVQSKAINFEKAMVSATPSPIKGFLAVSEFYREVMSALAKSSILGVPCALLMLPVPAGQDSAALISLFNLSRQGDLMTANSTHCYVFLYGCAETDVQALLPRLLGPHDARAMQDISSIHDSDAIVAALSVIADEEWVVDGTLDLMEPACVPADHFALNQANPKEWLA